MNGKYFFTFADIRQINDDPAVKPSGPQQRRIQYIGTIGCRNDNDVCIRLKTIELDKNLIEGLLALIMGSAKACAALASDCIDLIDKNNARSGLFCLRKKITHATGADSYKHLDKLRAGYMKKRGFGFAGNGFCK